MLYMLAPWKVFLITDFNLQLISALQRSRPIVDQSVSGIDLQVSERRRLLVGTW